MRPTVFVVPHTHWDREWYENEQRTRQRLVPLLDDALERLESTPTLRFMLDGQLAVVDDYLAIRPEHTARVRALVRRGRLIVGPWYVLADELLCTDETLVRNLLHGRRRGRELGGWQPVGYSPDAFGHSGALPMVLNGFGIRHAVVWRGYGGGVDHDRDLFRWTSADGSSVLTHHLPPTGYEFGAELPASRRALSARWDAMRAVLVPRAGSPHLVVLSGADHHAMQPDVVPAVRQLDAIESDYRVRLGTLEDYFAAVEAADPTLLEVRGELRWSYGYTWTLQGVHATRSRIKRGFAEAEALLQRWVEPQAALAGGRGRVALVDDVWQRHLLSAAHDSIGGCCTDEVAADVERRVANTVASARALLQDALLDRAGLDRVASRRNPDQWTPQLLLANPSPAPRRGVVEATVPLFLAHVPVGRPAPTIARRHPPVPALRVGDRRMSWPVQVLDHDVTDERFDSPRDYPDQDRVHALRIAVQTPMQAAFGLRGVSYRPVRTAARSVVRDPVRVRNGRLRASWCTVTAGVRGFDVRQNGRRVLAHLPALWSDTDLGDTYTFQPARDALRGARRARWSGPRPGWNGPLVVSSVRSFTVRDRVEGEVHIRLDAESRLIRCVVQGENLAAGHRLRVGIPVSSDGVTVADMAYGPETRVRRDWVRPPHPEEWPVRTAPMHRYVSVPGTPGVTVYARGVYEYELTDDDYLALTVFRSVDALSRHTLPTRPGHAGWPSPTPNAAELGPFHAEFAIGLDAVREESSPRRWAAVEAWAEEFHAPVAGRGIRQFVAPVEPADGPRLQGVGLVFKSLKPAEVEGALALRCVNPTREPVGGAWVWPGRIARAVLARLDEEAVQDLPVSSDGSTVAFDAAPRAVVTVLVWPAT